MINKRKLRVISIIMVGLFLVISYFLPFEYNFITFSSPEDAYKYYNCGADVKLVVDGRNSDFVVGEKNGTREFLIIPKVNNEWKVGVGADVKLVTSGSVKTVFYRVYRAKKTGDFFITIMMENINQSEQISISDIYDSKFTSIESDSTLGKKYINFYAYILDFDGEYWIKVNGEEIVIQ